MVAVPEEMPITLPEGSTEATDGALLLHEPPLDAESRIEDPEHTMLLPRMIGAPLTVTVLYV